MMDEKCPVCDSEILANFSVNLNDTLLVCVGCFFDDTIPNAGNSAVKGDKSVRETAIKKRVDYLLKTHG